MMLAFPTVMVMDDDCNRNIVLVLLADYREEGQQAKLSMKIIVNRKGKVSDLLLMQPA